MHKTTWEKIGVQMDASGLIPLPTYSSYENKIHRKKEEQSTIKPRRRRKRKKQIG
ncbi:hypothetical protein RchiOBHm_Chr1g0354951 [Rosa chinensis]|uniref:Uncharacterized protein n=1 Tax=Rosa chinensis TaxID=74649 RepID=A0A2P6SHD4_ROSCH|nr:hypothetical protein RchiOBHm_Chr5g0013151 [Rosa chinensis]PRQ58046.1 hypothetical protein RchiOBHm_Chr1g0354951 [Rosa chinensis]